MRKNWNGMMKVLEIQQVAPDGSVLWQKKNIRNVMHLDGEQFLLQAAFVGGSNSTIIPEYYYLGLDNRQIITPSDTVESLIGEPIGNGYERQGVSSSGDFSINFEQGHYIATSPIVAFRATVTSWGPVSNLFMMAFVNNVPKLLSTAAIESPFTVMPGTPVTMRIGMQLADCDDSEDE